MGAVKEKFYTGQEQHIEENQYNQWLAEMQMLEELRKDYSLPDYVVMSNGTKCYLSPACNPEHNVCSCYL